MRSFNIGDVVVAEFPYTDREDKKIRPFIVVAKVGDFLWGVMLTSSVKFYNEQTYELSSSDVDFKLNKTTIARCEVIQTIQVRLCRSTIGKLNDECRDRILNIVSNLLGKVV